MKKNLISCTGMNIHDSDVILRVWWKFAVYEAGVGLKWDYTKDQLLLVCFMLDGLTDEACQKSPWAAIFADGIVMVLR